VPLARIPDVGSKGLILDQFPPELELGAWSAARNVRFSDGFASKVPGYSATLGTPSVAPYGVFYAPSDAATLYAYFGLAKAYSSDGAAQTNITRQADGNDVDYTSTAGDKWVGGVLTGILVVTNGVDAPQSWVPGANKCANLANWTSTHTCKSIRPFKNHLIALNVTENSTAYPYLVRWSHPADPGSLPSTWDITDTTKDAGQIDLADTPGEILDGGAMGDIFIVWKQNATYALRYIGAPLIFSSQKVTDQSGILAPNCWCETPLGLVVLTLGDVVLHVGDQPPKSIIDKRNRQWLFDNLNSGLYQRAVVAHYEDRSEVLIGFPSQASTTYCDKALVWNYAADTWAIRDLPMVSAATIGPLTASSLSDIWSDLAAVEWDASTAIWNADNYSLAEQTVVMASPPNTKIYALDGAQTADGTPAISMLERSGITFDAPERVKFVRAIRPRIDGDVGATVSVYVGAAMDVAEAPSWSGPYTFTIGSTLKVDCLASGRYIGVRLESNAASAWRLRSMDIDVELMGGY